MLLMSAAMLQADVEVISEQGSKPSQTVGIIEVRNDTKNDFGIGLDIQSKGLAVFKENQALTKDRVQGKLKGKDYLRITQVVGGQSRQGARGIEPLDVTQEFKFQVYNPKTKKSITYKLNQNSKRKIIALVVEEDKDGNISIRPQKGNRAKGLFTGSGASSGINLFGNVTDEDIKKVA